MTIKPLFDKVVVENLKAEEKTKSGLYLTSAAQEKPATCLVVAVGPGGLVDGKDVKCRLRSAIKFCLQNTAERKLKLTKKNTR